MQTEATPLTKRAVRFTSPMPVLPWLKTLGWVALLLVCVAFSLKRVIAASQTPTDFCTDYVAAQRVTQGIPPYLPLRCWSAITPFFPEFDSHPPTSIPFFLPFTLLSREHAILLWSLLSLAAYVVTGVLLLNELGWRSVKGLALFMLGSLVWMPFLLAENIMNLTQVLTLLVVVAWVLSRRGYGGWAAGLLGLGGLIKIWPALLLIHALVRREWQRVWSGGLVLVLGLLLSLILLRPTDYSTYFGLVQQNEISHIPDSINSSLVSAVARPFLGLPAYPRSPLIPGLSAAHAVLLGELVAGAVLVGVLALIWWRGRQVENLAVEGLCQGLLVTTVLLLFPVTWYWVILPVLLPCSTTLLALRELPRPPRWWFGLLALALSQPAGLGWGCILLAEHLGLHQTGHLTLLETTLMSLPTLGMLLFAGLQAWLLWRSGSQKLAASV